VLAFARRLRNAACGARLIPAYALLTDAFSIGYAMAGQESVSRTVNIFGS
jgi:hypothetical protein